MSQPITVSATNLQQYIPNSLPNSYTVSSLTQDQSVAHSHVFNHNHNTIVTAVAGAGKTYLALTTSLASLSQNSSHHVLYITSSEISRRWIIQQVSRSTQKSISERLHVHTINSLASCYFSRSRPQVDEHDDYLLEAVVYQMALQTKRLSNYQLLVIDDAQTLEPLSFLFMQSFLSLLSLKPLLMLLGDPFYLVNQSSQFTSEDYLLRAKQSFQQGNPHKRSFIKDAPFEHIRILTSVRISAEIADWIQEKLHPRTVLSQDFALWKKNQKRIGDWWDSGIFSLKDSMPDSILSINLQMNSNIKETVAEVIEPIFKQFGDSNVIMLGMNVHQQDSPVRMVTKFLGNSVRISSRGSSETEMDGYRILTNVDEFDCLEREAVILFGVELIQHNEQGYHPLELINMYYTAATRAKRQLILVNLQKEVLAKPEPKPHDRLFHYDDLTEEQQAVVDTISKQGYNVIVNAVAGSGKTRTALTTAVEFLHRKSFRTNILLVAYNKRLQEDMMEQRNRSVAANLRQFIDIRTIHGLAHYYFGRTGLTTDKHLAQIVSSQRAPARELPNFELVIIDEAQDLTPSLFHFLKYFISFLARPQLLIVGDPFQLLYRFNGADESYIVKADEKFKDVVKEMPFRHLKLSVCFRITHEMAEWINTNLNPNNLHRSLQPYKEWFEQYREQIASWWGDGIRANPNRPREPNSVEYFVRSDYEGYMLKAVLREIKEFLRDFDTDSSALIAPSIVSNEQSPVRLVTNGISTIDGNRQSWYHDCGTHVEDTDRSDVRRNKRIASTIHRFKGRERDGIVLVGMDCFAERVEQIDPRNVFNLFYVGATRARKKLLIIQWSSPAYATHRSREVERLEDTGYKPTNCPVTTVLEYCPYDPILCQESSDCITTFTETTVKPRPLQRDDYIVRGSHSGRQGSTLENVSSVIGVAVEIKFQLLLDNGKLQVPYLNQEDLLLKDYPFDLIQFIELMSAEAETRTSFSWAEILQLATAQLTLNDSFFHRWRQMRDFQSWPVAMNSQKLDRLVENLVNLVYVPFCHDTEYQASQNTNPNPNVVSLEEKLAALQSVRRDGRLILQHKVTFKMNQNEEFVRRHGAMLEGLIDIVLLPPGSVESPKPVAEEREELGSPTCSPDYDLMHHIRKLVQSEEDVGKTIIVEVKTTTKVMDDHRLQVGCYGAIWREEQICRAKENEERSNSSQIPIESSEQVNNSDGEEKEHKQPEPKHESSLQDSRQSPRMYLAYPNLGLLRRVCSHMNSFEFLHRVGCRKISQQFDMEMLNEKEENNQLESSSVEPDEVVFVSERKVKIQRIE